MKFFKALFLLIGLSLLAWAIQDIDFDETLVLISQIGWGGGIIVGVYFLAFLFDTLTWHITVLSAPLTTKWLYRFFLLRLAGEAFNNILPAASVGGEPIKAAMLKNLYDFNYGEGIASLILSRTINTLSLVVFLTIGLFLVINNDVLDDNYTAVASSGLGILSLGILLFFCAQRFRVASHAITVLSKIKLFHWLKKFLRNITELDDILINFYKDHHTRLIYALILAFTNWILGAVEIYVTMHLIGNPISLVDAWIIEAIAQLVRTATFFIPASIGAQEGVFLIFGTAFTGSPATGLTMAITRRIREIIWIIWGLLVFYVVKPNTKTVAKK